MTIQPPVVTLGPKACAALALCFLEWRDAWTEEHGRSPEVPDEVTEAVEEMILCATCGDVDDEDEAERAGAAILTFPR